MANARIFERGTAQTQDKIRTAIEIRTQGRATYQDRSALLEETEADDVLDIDPDDEESWGGEETDQEGTDQKNSDFPTPLIVHPLWALYKGRLLWATANIGRDVQEREFFRRRIQAFLDFLAERFPDKTDEDRLLAMQGLFVADKKGKKEGNAEAAEPKKGEGEKKRGRKETSSTWLDRLQSVGIVYGEDNILPLNAFQTGQGQGQNTFPEPLALLWLERELEKHHEDDPLAWRNCKEWIVGLKDFQEQVSDQLNQFQEEGKRGGLGLKKRNFPYNEGTLQRKHLGKWKTWWQERRRRTAGE